jgi:hypothetical protein
MRRHADVPGSLAQQLRTQAERLRLPPSALVATGHEDSVCLWLTRVADAAATSEVLGGILAVGEAALVAARFATTGGLIAKELSIDDACRARDRLSEVGTKVVFVRPDEAARLLAPPGDPGAA